jgi:hypothetical protein
MAPIHTSRGKRRNVDVDVAAESIILAICPVVKFGFPRALSLGAGAIGDIYKSEE